MTTRSLCSMFLGGILAVSVPTTSCLQASELDSLERGFRVPPNSAKPYTWWHWMNGHVTRAAITRDLEAMKQAGLGGFTLCNVSEGTPPGPVAYMSDAWWDLFRYTVSEAKGLGLEMGIGNCAGWSSSGGPWVTPDYAMQEVVWTEKRVNGPVELDEKLEITEPALGIERDMARNPEINKRYYVPREQVRGYYRDIALLAFPTLKGDEGQKPFRLKNWRAKAGFTKLQVDDSPEAGNAPVSEIIDPNRIVDLTSRLDNEGRLKWSVPPGEWTLLRLGYQPTGRQNHPAPLEGRGLEIDKLSTAAADFYWKHSIAKLIHAAGDQTGRTFNGVLIDSYEVGHQNWSASFPQDFRLLRGYDLHTYLPALTGRIVGDVDVTEKFLWDFRKTLSDLMVRNYYGRFAELSHQSGLKLSVEPYGTYGNTDDFTVAGTPDIPMTEWWALKNHAEHLGLAKLASSSAHTYGRSIADSEAFTGSPDRIFEEHPYSLKAQGDYFFCRGINRFSLHTFVHDPYKKLPGFGLGAYGSRFDPRNTWWPFAHAWLDYVARCQFVLQQGRFVADLLYFAGEDAPQVCKASAELAPAPPAGYDYDFCNREILDQLAVKGDHLVLPSGMSYRVMVLPSTRYMRPETLRKIEELVIAGATVVGPKPMRVPGLGGGKAEEAQLRGIADRLWGKCDGQAVTMNSHGLGRIYWGRPIAMICNDLKVAPDFSFQIQGDDRLGTTPYPGNGVEFIHRRVGNADVYFISNQHYQPQAIEALFRVKQQLPEIWHPDTGETEIAPQFRSAADGRTALTLGLDPAGSMFVVFRRPLNDACGVVAVERKGGAASVTLRRDGDRLLLRSREAGEFTLKTTRGGSLTAIIPKIPPPITLTGPWRVYFPAGWGAPERIELPQLISWTQHDHPDVRHFSGTATYRLELDIPADRLGEGYRQSLDLGDVQVIAEVFVNGTNLGVLWKAPYAADVTRVLRPGKNLFEIRVANLWVNRLIGDQQYPDDCQWLTNIGTSPKGAGLVNIPDWVVNDTPRPSVQRKTFTGWRWPHLENKELLPSGLLGPVRLVTEVEKVAEDTSKYYKQK